MYNSIKKVASIHDLTGFGRCGLSVATPVLSAMGHQVCPLPTAVLSTHPGGFEGFCFINFEESMAEYIAHWNQTGILFDCIYSGYMCSPLQIQLAAKFIQHAENTNHPLVVIDPVMGDNGKLYQIFDDSTVGFMRDLIRHADVITPNLTEACVLLGSDYADKNYTEYESRQMLINLHQLSGASVCIKGIKLSGTQLVNATFDRETNEINLFPYEKQPLSFPGTGDIFASVLAGSLLRGQTLAEAATFAGCFASRLVAETINAGTPQREGVCLESNLKYLWH